MGTLAIYLVVYGECTGLLIVIVLLLFIINILFPGKQSLETKLNNTPVTELHKGGSSVRIHILLTSWVFPDAVWPCTYGVCIYCYESFAGGTVVKIPPTSAGDARESALIPGWGRSCMPQSN